eukprot:3475661-Amphidinium_carterae.1
MEQWKHDPEVVSREGPSIAVVSAAFSTGVELRGLLVPLQVQLLGAPLQTFAGFAIANDISTW